MDRHLRYPAVAIVMFMTLTGSVTNAQSLPGELIKTPQAPANIQVPQGNVVFLKTHAIGTQNYVCRISDNNVAWTLFGPQATLFVSIKWIGGDISQQVMTHFLSPNPAENGTPRATWQSSIDTSAVWARAIASSTDPEYVRPNSIPWLLLEPLGTQRGPTGGTALTSVTFIQRLNTFGGVAPASGCSQLEHVGSTVLVPYSTDYYFYKASGRR